MPPFNHVVLFAWKPDATPEAIAAALDGLRAMKGRIPGVLDVSVGRNVTSRTPHTHGLLVVLASEADLPIYDAHEVHQDVVVRLIRPIVATVNALDFTDGVY